MRRPCASCWRPGSCPRCGHRMSPRAPCADGCSAAPSSCARARAAKNECHAVLARNLKGRPPMTDVFGKAGREWLAALELPADERETVEGCLREVDFLDCEVGMIERELAAQALSSEEIRRLMTVPGVSLVSAASFVVVIGVVARFS